MVHNGNETLTEARLADKLPSAFLSTIYEADRLRSLDNQSVDLSGTVEEFGGNSFTEDDVIEKEIQKVLTSFLTPERTIELPGLGLEADRIKAFAQYYKDSDDTPTGAITDKTRASADDLVFTFAGPEVYNHITGADDGDSGFINNFIIEDIDAGETITLIGEDGFNSSTEEPLKLGEDEMLFFTGDYIDLSEGKSIFHRLQWEDIDGDTDHGPDDILLSGRLSGAHLGLGQGAWLKRQGQLTLKAYEDGDAEIVPVAFYMGPGHADV